MSKFAKRASFIALAGIVALSVSVAPGVSSAQLTQSQIDAIVSLLESFGADSATVSNVTAALQGQPTSGTGGSTGSISGIPAGFTFTTNLTIGSTGNDVMYLQILLNSDPATQVAASGAGSPGNETTTFGPLTAAGVVKFQDKYASAVLAPVGLSAGTGFFGSSSRTQANALLGTGTPGTPSTPSTPSTPGQVNVTASGPAASIVVQNQAIAHLADFVFSGSGTVTVITFERVGVSADTDIDNVFLFEGDVRTTDSGSLSSDSEITFSNPSGVFSVDGTKTVSVKADIDSAAGIGDSIGIKLVSVTLSNGTVSGVPAQGNLHSVSGVSLSTAAIANAVGSGDTDPGTDILVWQGQLTVSTRDVNMSRMALRQIGSINQNDINNFRLFVDGVQVAQTQSLDSERYVTFSLDKKLTTGAKTIKVLADVIGGSNRTVQMSLRGAYDVTLADSQIAGANVRTTGTFPFGPSAFTVNAGSMTVVKTADSPAQNVVLDGSDIALARYTFTAFGEAIKVETLLVDFVHKTSAGVVETSTLRNGRVLVNGSQVGSTTTLDPTGTGTSFTTNFTVNPGSPATVEVRADTFDNDGTNAVTANDTILVTLSTGASNGIPQESLTPINVPTSDTDGATVTVAAGTLTLTEDATYGDRNVVTPQNQAGGYKLADWSLSNSNVEDVNVNTLTVHENVTDGDTFTVADLQNVYVKYGSSTTAIKSTISDGQAISVTFTIAPNQTMPIEIWGNILSGNITADATLIMALQVTATSASGTAANVTETDGQTLTAKTSGTVTASLNTGSSPVAQIVTDNQTVTTGVFNFTTTDESFTVTDVTVTIGSASAVQNVILKNAATGATLASKPGATTITFNDIALPVAANSVSALLVEAQLGTVGVSAGATGSSIQTTVTAATAQNAQGTDSAVAGLGSGVNGRAMYVYASVPEITLVALPTTNLTANSEVVMQKFTVASTGGTIEWDEILFTVAKTASANIIVTAGDLTLYDVTSGTRDTVAGAFTVVTLGNGDTAGTIAFDATDPEQITGSRTYELVETNGSAVSANGSMGTRITQPSSFAASVAAGSVGGSSSLVWSDTSAQLHTVSTTDWTNDYKIKGLPTTTQTVSISTF